MDPTSTNTVVLNLVFALLIVCGFFLMRYKLIKLQASQMQELGAPLLAKEAAKGYNVCQVCAFENFKASAFCMICGEKIVEEGADDAKPEGESGVQVHQFAVKPSFADHTANLTQRQLRVRKRREWTRKLDIEGRMFWYRESVNAASSSKVFTGGPLNSGFVVRFTTTPAPSGNDSDAIANTTKDADHIETEGESSGSNNTSRQISATKSEPLAIFSDDISMEVVVSTDADAAMLATGVSLDAIERKNEAIAHASQDFPTKFANFVVTTASLLVPAEVEFLKVSVHRAFALEESMEHLCCIEERFIRSVMRINFLDESGVDAGGLHREWFTLLNELLMQPATGLFICTNKSEQVYALNPTSQHDNGDDHLIYYYAAGRLIGRALLEGVVLNFHLALPLLKIVLGIPVTMSDVEYLDPETFKSMQWIAEHDDVESLCLDFSVTQQQQESSSGETSAHSGEVVIVDLIPNGRHIAVTDANKVQYLERKFHYMMFESVSSQLYMFLKGMYEVIPASVLMLFDAEELDYLLCGSQEIDVKDWKRNSVHSSFLAQTPVLAFFWEIVYEMPNEYRRRLLQFTTGCSRVPLVGFKGLTSYDGKVCLFTVKALSATDPQFIRSHACFNRIDLPVGVSRQELKEMLYAILDTDIYGFTTS